MNRNFPLVSVCMISYNHANFIEEALNNVLSQQTDFGVEIIISDDKSTDDTPKIIESIIMNYLGPKRFRYFAQKENLGIIKNFIFALDQCQGQYIAVCEGDDYWDDPYKLQKQVDFLELYPDYVISFHEVEKIDSSGRPLDQAVLGKERWKDLNQKQLITGELVPTVSAAIRGSYIKNLPHVPKSLVNGDTFLFAILGQYGKAHFHPDIKPAKYRIHGGGVWSGANAKIKIESQVYTFEILSKAVLPENRKIVLESLFERYLTQFTRYDYSKYDKVKMYFNFWKFSINNQLIGKIIRSHFQAFKNKIKF